MTDNQFTILCCLITFSLNLLHTWLIGEYNNSKTKKQQKYYEFYKNFYVIWNETHQGRAFEFTDLKKSDRQRIINFLLEHYYYASEELQMLIYELKTNQLNNFDNGNEENKKSCNECYRKIIDYMLEKEQKYRKKYNSLNY